MARLIRRYVRYPLEAAVSALFFGFFMLLPPPVASAIGGFVGRILGPLIPVSARARRNLRRAMPELDEARIATIVRGMWENLGRVAGEYPHIERIARIDGSGFMEVANAHLLEPYRDGARQFIAIGSHLANWEMVSPVMRNCGAPFAQVYRAPNNPLVNRMIQRVRRMPRDMQLPKGAAGARRMVAVLKSGGSVGMAADQKLNDGISVPFFGRPAMTPPAPARLGLRFDCPVIPLRMERLRGCHYRMTVFPPLERPKANDTDDAVLDIMTRANAMLEGWIRERPEQWLWLHRRWPD